MFFIVGGHWAVLQTVAWTGMVITYSKDPPLIMALEKTFSGRAPCKMCRTIEAGKEKESRLPVTVKAEIKIDKFLPRPGQSAPLPREAPFTYPPGTDELASARLSAPPAPVPRSA